MISIIQAALECNTALVKKLQTTRCAFNGFGHFSSLLMLKLV
jgi:hypothetical protein